MNKNILIINSGFENCELFSDLFSELKNRAYKLYFATGPLSKPDESNLAKFAESVNQTDLGWPRAFRSRADSGSRFKAYIFIFLLPWYWLKFGLKIIYYKFAKKINTILLFNTNEKIIVSPLAKLFRIKLIWLELPDSDYQHLPALAKYACRRAGAQATILDFNRTASSRLEKIGLAEPALVNIDPGIRLKAYKHQESIFDSLAQKEHDKINHKFFTIGTVIGPHGQHGLEYLFRAAGKILDVIPNLQLIIVGESHDNKNLIWLAKQFGVETIVWFVGRQEHLKKWLLNFNVYTVTDPEPSFTAIMNLLRAMETGLPIVLPRSTALENYLSDNRSGLYVDIDSSDSLANRLIELKRNNLLRKRLGQGAYERLLENYTLDKMVEQLVEVL